MRAIYLRAALVAVGVASASTLLAVTPAPPTGRRTARDLTGTWTASDGSRLVLDHKTGGDHALSGTLGAVKVVGGASVSAPLATGDVFVDITWTPAGTKIAARTDRYLAAKDRTSLVSATRTLARAVPPGFTRLRLMTYNIRGVDQRTPADHKDFARIIKANKADIVALQEVKAAPSFLGGLFNQAKLIAHHAGYGHVYQSAFRAGPIDEGEAILVNEKGPLGARIVSSKGVRLPRGPGVDPSKDLSRVALVTEIELKGNKRFHAICTHSSSSFESSRIVQHAEVSKLMKAPGVLMGDLNAGPGAPSMKDLRAKLLDVFPAANPADPGFTSSPQKPHARIDYVLLDKAKGGRALASWTLDSPGPQRGNLKGHRSDHFGLVAVVDLELN